MKTERQFLIARSLARLIQKERGVSARAVEGYITSDSDKIHFVRIDSEQCHLVLRSGPQGGEVAEERTELSRQQAESLLNVCVGKVAYDRTRLPLGGNREAVVDRFVAPGQFDLVTVEFETANDASSFFPPAWFGPEVTGDAAYGKRTLALNGAVQGRDVALSNAALDSLLDLIENRFSLGRFGSSPSSRPRPEVRPAEAPQRPVPVEAPQRPAVVQTERPAPTRVREPAPVEAVSMENIAPQPVREPVREPVRAPVQAHALAQAHAPAHSHVQAVAHALDPSLPDADPHDAPSPADDAGRFDDVLATLSRALVDPGFLGNEAQPARPVAVELDRSARRLRREER